MTNLRSRFRSHLSYANVMASIAVFFALGGVGYAATSINGNEIKKQTVGAGKLKNGTLTSTQVKQNALTGSVTTSPRWAPFPRHRRRPPQPHGGKRHHRGKRDDRRQRRHGRTRPIGRPCHRSHDCLHRR